MTCFAGPVWPGQLPSPSLQRRLIRRLRAREIIQRLLPLGTLLFIAGCAVGPDLKSPTWEQLGAPSGWHATQPHSGSLTELSQWWAQFDDPALLSLLDAAERNSPSIAIASARIRAARASTRIATGSFLPAATASGSATKVRTKTKIAGTSTDADSTVKIGAVDAAWELDVFGGSRRELESSRAQLGAAEAGWHDARASIAAEVANTYATARAYQALLALYEEEVASRQATEKLTTLLIGEGLAPSANALAVEAATANSISTLESQRGQYAQVINGLVALTTLGVPEIERLLAPPNTGIPQIKTGFSVSLPADVLKQRPDVRAAEYQLASASAQIGVAIADLLPSLTLVGSIGINSARTSGINNTTKTWSFGPAVNLPVFLGGRGRARVEATRAAYDQALASYHATVRNAVSEIENSLVRVDTVERRRGHVAKAAEKFHTYFDAINESYRAGKSSLFELETARLQNVGSQQLLVSVELERTQAWVALYKAVGGGWAEPGDAMAAK